MLRPRFRRAESFGSTKVQATADSLYEEYIYSAYNRTTIRICCMQGFAQFEDKMAFLQKWNVTRSAPLDVLEKIEDWWYYIMMVLY